MLIWAALGYIFFLAYPIQPQVFNIILSLLVGYGVGVPMWRFIQSLMANDKKEIMATGTSFAGFILALALFLVIPSVYGLLHSFNWYAFTIILYAILAEIVFWARNKKSGKTDDARFNKILIVVLAVVGIILFFIRY